MPEPPTTDTFSPAAARGALVQAAAQLGFSALGIADAALPQGEQLRQWLEAGCHADMAWMERHLAARLDPQQVLPGARSVIMLTYEYARHDARRHKGSIARYAQGADYHKLLAAKLADLDETLQWYGGQQRCFTDSGPVSERFFAAQCGLGWIGRHGLLVRPRLGSYCFLASILTTLELPTDRPIKNHCGSCRRCLEACPTAALNGQWCDARRCLSFWTIEAKCPEPEDIRAARGERLYGCDTCQEACPWNHTPSALAARIDPQLLMPAVLADATPEELAALDEEGFNTLFAGSPIRRIGLAHLRANLRFGGETTHDAGTCAGA